MPTVAYVVGNDVSTDAIYPGRFMATVLPAETPQYAFADDGEFNRRLRSKLVLPGSVIVGGENFGCGSSREQAASALKGYEVVVIARSFGRIFLQNAINVGLRVILAPQIEAAVGDELEILPAHIANKTSFKFFEITAFAPGRQQIIDASGLIPYTRERLLARS